MAAAKSVLENLDNYYPGAKDYEVRGFFWWQGDRDSRSAALSSRYEKNLVHLIKQLRNEFDAPDFAFLNYLLLTLALTVFFFLAVFLICLAVHEVVYELIMSRQTRSNSVGTIHVSLEDIQRLITENESRVLSRLEAVSQRL